MANRFWVAGSGTWDSSDTTHWSSATGGPGGASVPSSADVAIFDANSSGAVVTVTSSFNSNNTLSGINTTAASAGFTLDFSVNNPSATMNTFLAAGSGTRTINFGTGTFTMVVRSGTVFDFGNVAGLTLSATQSTVIIPPPDTNGLNVNLSLSSKNWGTINISTGSSQKAAGTNLICAAGCTIETLTIGAPARLFIGGAALSISNPISVSATSANPVVLIGGGSTITLGSAGSSASYCSFNGVVFGTNTLQATNSFDGGQNSGITFVSSGTSGGGFIVSG